jgi:hypothetical protein
LGNGRDAMSTLHAAMCLTAVSAECPDARRHLVNAGAVEALVFIAGGGSTCLCARAAAQALGSLCDGVLAAQQRAIRCGAIVNLLPLLEARNASSHAAARALSQIAAAPPAAPVIESRHGWEAITAYMMDALHRQDQELDDETDGNSDQMGIQHGAAVSSAAQALAASLKARQFQTSALVDAGGLDVLAAAAQMCNRLVTSGAVQCPKSSSQKEPIDAGRGWRLAWEASAASPTLKGDAALTSGECANKLNVSRRPSSAGQLQARGSDTGWDKDAGGLPQLSGCRHLVLVNVPLRNCPAFVTACLPDLARLAALAAKKCPYVQSRMRDTPVMSSMVCLALPLSNSKPLLLHGASCDDCASESLDDAGMRHIVR